MLPISCRNSEEQDVKKTEHVVKVVQPGSIAEEMEICPGDVLLAMVLISRWERISLQIITV